MNNIKIRIKSNKKLNFLVIVLLILFLILSLFWIPIYNKFNIKLYKIFQFVPGATSVIESNKYTQKLELEGELKKALLVKTMGKKLNELNRNGDIPILHAPIIGDIPMKTSIRGKGMKLENIYDTLDEHDYYITEVCTEYNIPKEVLVSILFREMYCIDVFDRTQNLSFNLVSETSTLGFGQVSIKMAKKSEKAILAQERTDEDIFKSLTSETGNILSTAILVKYYMKLKKIDKITDKNAKIIFHRYNPGPTYSDSLYEYMLIFEEFYNNGGFENIPNFLT